MVDFLIITTRPGKKNVTDIYPKFVIKKSRDTSMQFGLRTKVDGQLRKTTLFNWSTKS